MLNINKIWWWKMAKLFTNCKSKSHWYKNKVKSAKYVSIIIFLKHMIKLYELSITLTVCFSSNSECLSLAFLATHLNLHHNLLLKIKPWKRSWEIFFVNIKQRRRRKEAIYELWLQIIPSYWQFDVVVTKS